MKILKFYNQKKGFSLIEIVAVLFIITIGLVGVMSLVIQNLQVENFNKSKIIAHELSQEGIELVRRNRDSNWLSSQAYNNGLATGTYVLDYKNPTPKGVGGLNEDGAILQKQSGGEDINFYFHDTTYPNSDFRRVVFIDELTDHSFLVSSKVRWSERGRTHTYISDTILYDWD